MFGDAPLAFATGMAFWDGSWNGFAAYTGAPYEFAYDMSVDTARGVIFACGIFLGTSNAPSPGGSGALEELITTFAPEGVSDTYTATEGKPLIVNSRGVLAHDIRALGGTASVVTAPAHGTLKLSTNGAFTYTPQSGYIGPDSFVYLPTNNGAPDSNTTVKLSVTGTQLVPNPAKENTANLLHRRRVRVFPLREDRRRRYPQNAPRTAH